jgi:hypothetical protein
MKEVVHTTLNMHKRWGDARPQSRSENNNLVERRKD